MNRVEISKKNTFPIVSRFAKCEKDKKNQFQVRERELGMSQAEANPVYSGSIRIVWKKAAVGMTA